VPTLAIEYAQLDRLGMRRRDRDVHAGPVDVRAERPRPAETERAHTFHSKKTVASGGKVSAIDCGRPCHGTASAVTSPYGVPTLLPP